MRLLVAIFCFCASVAVRAASCFAPDDSCEVNIRTVTDFRRLSESDFDKAVDVFWDDVVFDRRLCSYCADIAMEHYLSMKDVRGYYQFLKKLTVYLPDNVDFLHKYGDLTLRMDMFEDAYKTYMHIYEISPEDFTANSFFGNYYYNEGSRRLNELDEAYAAARKHTKMEESFYLEKKKKIVRDFFYSAYRHFKAVDGQLPSLLITSKMEKIKEILSSAGMPEVR